MAGIVDQRRQLAVDGIDARLRPLRIRVRDQPSHRRGRGAAEDLHDAALAVVNGEDRLSGQECGVELARRVVGLAASQHEDRGRLDLHRERVEVVDAGGDLGDTVGHPELVGDREDARRRVRPRLVAGAEEVEVNPLVPLRTPLPQPAHRAQQRTEHLEPERQECPDVAEVDRAVGGVEIRVGAGLAPEAIEVRRLPADRNDGAGDRAELRIAAPECVTGRTRDRRDRVGGPDSPRLESSRQGARQPALDVGPAVRARAHGLPPGPHPWVLIVENERHAEPPLEDRPEQRRVRRVDRDEQGVEAFPSQQVRARAAKAVEGPQPEIPDTDAPRPPRGPGTAADDPKLGGHEARQPGIEASLVVARIHRDHRRLPAVCRQARREEAHAMSARARVRRKVRADQEHARHDVRRPLAPRSPRDTGARTRSPSPRRRSEPRSPPALRPGRCDRDPLPRRPPPRRSGRAFR